MVDPAVPDDERVRFAALQARLPAIWRSVVTQDPQPQTSVVVPSLTLAQEELSKVQGVPFYEERLLFSLIRLRDPRVRVVYVTSQPIHPSIIDYYLALLVGVPASHARKRLHLFCVHDAGPKPLTEKVLERPRLLARLRAVVGDPEYAYLTCFNSTWLERRLANALGIPLNGADPDLLDLGSKSGSRKIFREAGVMLPSGFEDMRDVHDVESGLIELSTLRPGLRRAVVKLNEGFAGTGNALFTYPRELPGEPAARLDAIRDALRRLELTGTDQTPEEFLERMSETRGVVEEMVEAEETRSPSVQLRINPDGGLDLVSSHDQVLGGSTGQTYLGCRFPADPEYRTVILEEAKKIGQVVRGKGVISRFAVDFLVTREQGGPWQPWAIEINLRMGGTTHPFLALEFLTGGQLDHRSGELVTPRGQRKHYFATDNLRSEAYRQLLPDDLFDIVAQHRMHFTPATDTGVLFHMIGALSQFGKVGVTCIGDDRKHADALYRHTVEVLDYETGGSNAPPGDTRLHPFEVPMPRME